MSTVADLFTRVWSCHARVFTNFKCSAEEPNRDPRHEGCGYRYQASFTEEDFAGIKDMTLVSSEHMETIRGALIEKGMTTGFPDLIGKGRMVSRDFEGDVELFSQAFHDSTQDAVHGEAGE